MTQSFTVFGKPEPQGSMKAFVVGGKARLTSNNAKLKPWRQQVAGTALAEGIVKSAKHIPVLLELDFYISRPPSTPKKRTLPAVRPDADKMARAANDALTGIAYVDDGQVCELRVRKFYGSPERTEIRISEIVSQ